jgi:hypothetical protein
MRLTARYSDLIRFGMTNTPHMGNAGQVSGTAGISAKATMVPARSWSIHRDSDDKQVPENRFSFSSNSPISLRHNDLRAKVQHVSARSRATPLDRLAESAKVSPVVVCGEKW